MYRSLTAPKLTGKSLPFMIVVFIGYISGILHKLFYLRDGVLFLYILNALMVGTDIVIYLVRRQRGDVEIPSNRLARPKSS
ncbi:MAG: hypothetical protein N2442_07565 [Spirochaetes bacterium]|nr:hypothetical protein [Spirochaetota bacterium]